MTNDYIIININITSLFSGLLLGLFFGLQGVYLQSLGEQTHKVKPLQITGDHPAERFYGTQEMKNAVFISPKGRVFSYPTCI